MSDDQGYDLSQFKATYFEECAELLATAEETIARLQEGTGSDEDLNAVFRCVHSIKGALALSRSRRWFISLMCLKPRSTICARARWKCPRTWPI